MSDPDLRALHQHTHDVEPVGLVNSPVTRDPDPRRTTQLPLLLPVHGFHRVAEAASPARLHLDECYQPFALDHEIDVTMAGPKTTLDHPPAALPKPSFGYSFPEFAKCLPGR